MRVSFLLVALSTLSRAAAAQDSLAKACEHARTTVELERCASRALEDARAHLKQYVQEARRVATNRALLDSAQAAWERYGEITCRAAGSQYEGTMKPLVVLNCFVDLTRTRLHDIYDDYLKTSESKLPEPRL